MSALLLSMPLATSFRDRLWKLACRYRVFLRYWALALLADAVGYSLVIVLGAHGVGALRANTGVSVAMAPVGLALNSWALTGRFWPGWGRTGSWFVYWLPTSARNTIYMAWLIATFGLSGVEPRASVAVTFFLLDYAAKRWIIFGKYGELAHFYFTKVCIRFYYGALLGAETA